MKSCLFIIFSSLFFTWALSANNLKESKVINITHPGFKTSEFQGSQVILTGNEMDISDLVSGIERATQPYHDIFHFINTDLKEQIMAKMINPLCQEAENPDLCQQSTRQKLQVAINSLGEKLSEGVFYPEEYWPIGSSKAHFKASMDFFKKECPDQCTSNIVATALLYGTDAEYSQLYDKIKNRSDLCQKNILESTEKQLGRITMPKECLNEENKNHVVCETISQHVQTIQTRIFALTELTYGFDALKHSVVTFCFECKFLERTQENTNFLELIGHLEDQIQCSTLEPGQQKRVYANTFPTNNESYDLKRETDGSYSVTFNLKFSADSDYDGPVPPEHVHAYYVDKVQKCMDVANQKLLGPNGEKLKLIINKPGNSTNDICLGKNTKNISIRSKSYRHDSKNYASDIDCPTITHEVLHLLGLCDEYKEEKLGYYTDPLTGEPISNEKKNIDNAETSYHSFILAYDCRIIKENSIMSDQQERWDNVFKNNTEPSLLTTEQFNAILYGSCEEKNKTFNKCSQLAYQSSIESPECMKKKQECEEELTNEHTQ